MFVYIKQDNMMQGWVWKKTLIQDFPFTDSIIVVKSLDFPKLQSSHL